MSDSDSSLPKISALAPWRSPLARALHRNRSRPYSRYFQLATVTAAGRPANRTVVFRGWLPNTNTLILVTDQRSAKVADISAHAWGEACWYLTHTREQFRLGGPLSLVTASATGPTLVSARDRAWADLSDAARQSFYWPHPAQPRQPDADFSPREVDANPPADFCLMLLTPHQVDHLALRGDPQQRTLYTQQTDHTWSIETVNP